MIIRLLQAQDIQRIDDEERRQRMLTSAIGLILIGILLVTLLMLMGCSTTTNSGIAPAALQAAVTLGTEFGLEKNPEAVPAVRVAKTVVCSAAAGTNIAPTEIVAALNQAGITNSTARLIVNSALATYNIAFSFYGTNLTQFRPYADALCQGLTLGLPPEAGTPPMPMAKKSYPHLQ